MVNDKTTRLFGLVGHPLGHSFSRKFFTDKFMAEQIDARYINFDLHDLDMLDDVVSKHPNLAGFNVTIPYKEKIITKLDELDATAKLIGAVNTVKVYPSNESNKGYRLKGYNTDIIGFTESIRPFLSEHHCHALILGTGGASKAIAAGLQRSGIDYKFVSRRRSDNAISYSELTDDLIINSTLIINTTPLGMWPNIDTSPSLPYNAIGSSHLCFDAVYNPSPTLFLKQCAERGATIVGGLEMLRLQALASWKIWTDE